MWYRFKYDLQHWHVTLGRLFVLQWASAWQNKMNCVSSKDSDQPVIPPGLNRVFLSAWRNHGSLAIYEAHCKDSDWAELCLRWAHSYFVNYVVLRLKCDLRVKCKFWNMTRGPFFNGVLTDVCAGPFLESQDLHAGGGVGGGAVPALILYK